MPSIDFPNSPSVNDVFTVGNTSYVWNGTVWVGSSLTTVSWDAVSEKPSTFSPSTHTHAISDTTGLQTALDGKLSATVSSPSSGQVISYNGSAWVNSAAPASGGMTLISDTTLAAGVNTVTLSSIPQTYKKLELEINQTGGVSAPSTATMVFNGQTSSTYSWGAANFFASTGVGSGAANFSYGISQAAGVILPGITAGSTSVTIPNYTSTTVYKNFQYFNFTGYIQSSANSGSGIWNSFAHGLSAISSIGFTFSNVGGSTIYRVKLWGIN